LHSWCFPGHHQARDECPIYIARDVNGVQRWKLSSIPDMMLFARPGTFPVDP